MSSRPEAHESGKPTPPKKQKLSTGTGNGPLPGPVPAERLTASRSSAPTGVLPASSAPAGPAAPTPTPPAAATRPPSRRPPPARTSKRLAARSASPSSIPPEPAPPTPTVALREEWEDLRLEVVEMLRIAQSKLAIEWVHVYVRSLLHAVTSLVDANSTVKEHPGLELLKKVDRGKSGRYRLYSAARDIDKVLSDAFLCALDRNDLKLMQLHVDTWKRTVKFLKKHDIKEPTSESVEGPPKNRVAPPTTSRISRWDAPPPSRATLPLSKATLPLSKATLPLSKATLPLSKATLPLSKATLPLSNAPQPSSKHTLPLPKATQPPTWFTQPPSKSAQQFSKSTQPPSKSTQTSPKSTPTSRKSTQTSRKYTESSRKYTETSRKYTQSSLKSTQTTPESTQPPARATQPSPEVGSTTGDMRIAPKEAATPSAAARNRALRHLRRRKGVLSKTQLLKKLHRIVERANRRFRKKMARAQSTAADTQPCYEGESDSPLDSGLDNSWSSADDGDNEDDEARTSKRRLYSEKRAVPPVSGAGSVVATAARPSTEVQPPAKRQAPASSTCPSNAKRPRLQVTSTVSEAPEQSNQSSMSAKGGSPSGAFVIVD